MREAKYIICNMISSLRPLNINDTSHEPLPALSVIK